MTLIFWILFGLILYIYIGYPLCLRILVHLIPIHIKNTDTNHASYPLICMVIATYNEEKIIANKIANCLALDYPNDRLAIWFASDGSNDQTNPIIKSMLDRNNSRLHLLEYPRSGKCMVLNRTLEQINADIVVFSDANTIYQPDALNKIVSYFNDPQVGCVCGRLVFRNPGEVISGKGEGIYWRYESVLKRMESQLGYVSGANGAIYAIRKSLYRSLPPNTINDDFMISMSIIEKGFKCIYAEDAIAFEEVAPSLESEFNRHIRDAAGHYIAVARLWRLLNPLLGIRWFIYFSHRILRWTAPFILISIFIINAMIFNDLLYRMIFIAQVSFYLLAIWGLLTHQSGKMPIYIFVPFYFCNLNLALLVGFLKAVCGMQKPAWDSTPRT